MTLLPSQARRVHPPVARGQRGLRAREVFVDVDAVALEGREQVIDFLGGMDFRRQDVVYLIVKEVTALLAHIDQLTYLVVFLFNCQRQVFLPRRGELSAADGTRSKIVRSAGDDTPANRVFNNNDG